MTMQTEQNFMKELLSIERRIKSDLIQHEFVLLNEAICAQNAFLPASV